MLAQDPTAKGPKPRRLADRQYVRDAGKKFTQVQVFPETSGILAPRVYNGRMSKRPSVDLFPDGNLPYSSGTLLNVGSEAQIPAVRADEDRATRLGRLLRRLALAGVVMMVLLACVSAYLRLSAAGVGCVPWPACYQRTAAVESQHHPVARLAHRVLASTLGVVVVMIALASVSVRPRRPVVMGAAFAALAVTLALAGLGRVTSMTANTPAVALANLLGGMVLAALLWSLALRARRDPEPATIQSRWPASVVAVIVLIQVGLGAFISTTHTAPACPTLPLCVPAASDLPAVLQVFHRVLAIALLAAAGVLVATLLRRGGHAAHLALGLAGLLLVQMVSGALMIALDFPLWLALAHNAGALLLLLAAVWVLAG